MTKPVKGYEGLYEVDDQGNVYSLLQTQSRRKGKLHTYTVDGGYQKVNLYDANGKCKKCYVHRLVAEAFIDNPDNLSEVNHLDCDTSNNSISNLEWCTRIQNLQHAWDHGKKCEGEAHGMHKLTEAQVREIRNSNKSQKELAKDYGVARCTINAILNFKLWKKVI